MKNTVLIALALWVLATSALRAADPKPNASAPVSLSTGDRKAVFLEALPK